MNEAFYPDQWSVIAAEIKANVGWRCTCCNLQCRRPGEFYIGWEYELALAHITQDYDAPAVQVQPMCGRCHFEHDAPLSWVARRRAERWRLRQAGQMDFFAARG